MKSQKSKFAGQFYPPTEFALRQLIDRLLASSPTLVTHPTALVVPHAGYVYSGQAAAVGYKQIVGQPYSTVIILGPTHQVYSTSLALPDADAYETPLGIIPFDMPIIKRLLASKLIVVNGSPHQNEHSLEVQLPFIRLTQPNAKIVPISVGSLGYEALYEAGKVLASLITDTTLLVISTDLSHYHPLKTAQAIDSRTIDLIMRLDNDALVGAYQRKDAECCGLFPILLAFQVFAHLGRPVTPTRLTYDTSATASFDDQHVVGYTSIAFC